MGQAKESSKIGKDLELWYLFLRNFWTLGPKSYFSRGIWALDSACIQLRDFSGISLFPKIWSLQLLRNSWGKSYTKFILLENKSGFTCGESDMY